MPQDASMLNEIRASIAKARSWQLHGPWLIFAALIVALAFYMAYQFVEPAPPRELTISSGSPDGAYHQTAVAYQRALAQEGVTLTIVNSAGSIENLERLQDDTGEVDVAFVQGGIGRADADSELIGLASLYFEPIWLFTPADAPIDYLHELAGKRIDLGADGSGTYAVATQLLSINRVEASSYNRVDGGRDAAEAMNDGELDAVFRVGSPRSPAILALLENPAVRAMPFARAPAYARHLPFLEPLVLYAGSLSLAENRPAQDIQLLAPAATLVARSDIHPALVQLLMQTVTAQHGAGSLLAEPETFPSARWLDDPIHSDAARYLKNGPPFLQRYLPFWMANLLDRMKIMLVPLIALMLPMSRLLPPTYRWRMRRRIYQWYDEVQMIDSASHDASERWRPDDCLRAIDEIENEIRRVDVPLSFYHELYTLRQHIDLLRQQLRERA